MPSVATFEYDLEKNLIEIEQDLKNETFELGGYHSFPDIRYVDDFLLFAQDKEILWEWKHRIEERLASLRLTTHPCHPIPVSEGFSFLGFRIFPQKRRLKRRKGLYYQRKLRRMLRDYAAGDLSFDELTASIQGWVNHARYGNTVGLRKAVLGTSIVPGKRE